ncbi:MAG: hypothetical protein GTO18_09465 [Anaerolineales bacterium]|nr:hypothetical protein [Anaerolineales bacterium]
MNRFVVFTCLLLSIFIMFGTALASTTASYELTWWTVDGGGGESTSGTFSVNGTMGQHDAGTMSGGSYGLSGGFWGRVVAILYDLFLPLIMR